MLFYETRALLSIQRSASLVTVQSANVNTESVRSRGRNIEKVIKFNNMKS